MAKLVAVCRDEEFPFERRQIPLTIEETLTMVMEIPETVISTEWTERVNENDVHQFTKRYNLLTLDELTCALVVNQKELFALLSVSVPCVGCRRSVERLYNQLWESKQPALEPLLIQQTGVLSISENFLFDPRLIYALFYIHGSHLNDMVDTIPKSRRNRRCLLHSLETHKARSLGWMDVWDLLSQECRDEVVLIDSEALLDTLENYLRKHRFCSECKSKVLRAYSILSGDIDGDSEKGYCKALYDGLRSCPKEKHIHVLCETDFIAHLIGRAEPELAGGRRERHARTIDIAQEEVLTCLGIHLWERLHRLWQKLRAEEQTWQMLFYLGVEALRKSFETAVEDKQGISRLEQVVEEISEAERAKELRKEAKRLKKKKRKENKCKCPGDALLCPNEEKPSNDLDERRDESPSSEERDGILDLAVDSNSNEVSPRSNECRSTSSDNDSYQGESHVCSSSERKEDNIVEDNCKCGDDVQNKKMLLRKNGYNRGYDKTEISYHSKNAPSRFGRHGTVNGYVGETCKDCGPPSSCGKYRGAKHERNSSPGSGHQAVYAHHHSALNGNSNIKRGKKKSSGHGTKLETNDVHHGYCGVDFNPSKNCHKHENGVEDDEELKLLMEMGWKCPGSSLSKDPCLSDEEIFISEQEIKAFKANKKQVQSKRQELREKLREQFEKMSVKCCSSTEQPLNGIHIK